jgi:hypothetical protein
MGRPGSGSRDARECGTCVQCAGRPIARCHLEVEAGGTVRGGGSGQGGGDRGGQPGTPVAGMNPTPVSPPQPSATATRPMATIPPSRRMLAKAWNGADTSGGRPAPPRPVGFPDPRPRGAC